MMATHDRLTERLEWHLRGLEIAAASYRDHAPRAGSDTTRAWCEGRAEAYEKACRELRAVLEGKG